MKIRRRGVGVALVACFLTSGWTVSAQSQAVSLEGAGATFPAPLYEAWIDAYGASHPDVGITYEAVGSSEGIRRFIAEGVDFGASDAAMTDAQMAEVARGAKLIPVTAGMVVLAYNIPDVPSGLKLTREAVTGIFLGEIRNWQDPVIADANPEIDLPDLTIAQVVRRDGSGTTFALTNHLSAVSDVWHERFGAATLVDWPGIAMTAIGNDGVAGRIKISWGSIGYVEEGFARRLGLSIAALENAAGEFVDATPETGQAALAGALADMPQDLRQFIPDPQSSGAYPIVTYSWLLLYNSYPDATVGDAVRDFARWGLTDGQALSANLDYIPLPSSVAERAMTALGLTN